MTTNRGKILTEAGVLVDVDDLGGGSSPVLVATKTLTDEEIKALPHPTPITVLPGQGAGTMIVPLHATLRLTWAADYTNIDSGASMAIKVGTTLALGRFLESRFSVDSLLAGGEDASGWMPPYATSLESPVTGVSGIFDGDSENQPVTLEATNGVASDFMGGHADNELKTTLLYYVVTF